MKNIKEYTTRIVEHQNGNLEKESAVNIYKLNMKKSKAAGEKIQVQKKKPGVKRKYLRDKTYTCRFCPKTSVGKYARRRHMFAMHKEELMKELPGNKTKNRKEI